MLYLGGYDITVKQRYQPQFFAVTADDAIIGVNSGHQTAEDQYRSRGIWVDPQHRGDGIGRMLIDAVTEFGCQQGCAILWSIPRHAAMAFYERCGFRRTSAFFDHGMEFGPNAYAMKPL